MKQYIPSIQEIRQQERLVKIKAIALTIVFGMTVIYWLRG